MKAEWPKASMNKLSFFLPCCNQINPLLPFAGISSLYFSLNSEDLRLQIWNVPLLEHFSYYTRTLHGLQLLGLCLSDLDPRTWPTDSSMDLKKSLMKAEWPKASMNKMSFFLSCCNRIIPLLTFAGISFLVFLAKEQRLALANLERSTLEHSSYYTHTDFTTWTYLLGFAYWFCTWIWNMDSTTDLKKFSLMKAEWPKASMNKLSFSLPCCNE